MQQIRCWGWRFEDTGKHDCYMFIIEKDLHSFNIDQYKPAGTPLATHFKLNKNTIPTTDEEKGYMSRGSYSSAVMYDMVCIRPDLSLYSQCNQQVYD